VLTGSVWLCVAQGRASEHMARKKLAAVLGATVAVTLHDLRAAAFAPSMLAAGSSRHSLCSSTGPALLAAGVLRCEGDMTAACSGQSQRRGRMLLLSAAASKAAEDNTSPTPAKTTAVETRAPVAGKAVIALCAFGCVLGFYALYVGTMANAPPPVGARRGATLAQARRAQPLHGRSTASDSASSKPTGHGAFSRSPTPSMALFITWLSP
jgi:hypothetical protein